MVPRIITVVEEDHASVPSCNFCTSEHSKKVVPLSGATRHDVSIYTS